MLSILGGEPFEPENQEGLVEFVEKVRLPPTKSIWMYSVHTWDQRSREVAHSTDRILSCIDVLVDGPWVPEVSTILRLRFRALPTSVIDRS